MGDFTNSNRGARFAIRLPVDKRKHCSLSVIPFGTEIVLGKTVARRKQEQAYPIALRPTRVEYEGIQNMIHAGLFRSAAEAELRGVVTLSSLGTLRASSDCQMASGGSRGLGAT